MKLKENKPYYTPYEAVTFYIAGVFLGVSSVCVVIMLQGI